MAPFQTKPDASFKGHAVELVAVIVNNAPIRVLSFWDGPIRSNIKFFAKKPTNHSRGLARPTNHSTSECFILAAGAAVTASSDRT